MSLKQVLRCGVYSGVVELEVYDCPVHLIDQSKR